MQFKSLLLMKWKLSSHFGFICSRGTEKYFRRGSRLNWPEGAVSRESIKAVKKLDRLKVLPLFLFWLLRKLFWNSVSL